MRRWLATAGAALALTLAARGAAAQQGVWTAEAAAGRLVQDPLAARVAGTQASLTIWRDGASALYGALGAPLGGDGPAWASAGVERWLQRAAAAKPLAPGLLLGLDTYGYAGADQDAGGGVAARVMPGFVARSGPLRLEARSGLLAAADQRGDSSTWRLMYDTGARLAIAPPSGRAELGAEARVLRAREGTYTYAGVSTQLTAGGASMNAAAGRWLNAGYPAPATRLALAATLRLTPSLDLTAAWAREPVDPVYFTAPRRAWSIGLARRFGRAATPAVPTLPVASAAQRGGVRIVLPAECCAAAPAVLGEFTGWQPRVMAREGSEWVLRFAAAPGTYRFVFRDSKGRIFVPEGFARVDDGMGGVSAVLVVQ